MVLLMGRTVLGRAPVLCDLTAAQVLECGAAELDGVGWRSGLHAVGACVM